jgi:hypothetical protein
MHRINIWSKWSKDQKEQPVRGGTLEPWVCLPRSPDEAADLSTLRKKRSHDKRPLRVSYPTSASALFLLTSSCRLPHIRSQPRLIDLPQARPAPGYHTGTSERERPRAVITAAGQVSTERSRP